MAAAGVALIPAGLSTYFRGEVTSYSGRVKRNRISVPSRISAVYTEEERKIPSVSENGRLEKEVRVETNPGPLDDSEIWDADRATLKDYFDHSKDLIKSDCGPPRWFSPLECASRLKNSPLLLFLPGIDGVGLGLIMHHQRLGKIFDIWCLHIPVMDRTTFTDLVKLVERTVRSEHYRSPNKPIYLVGESLGGCLALVVAARNPDIDLVLILANPATSFSKSLLQPLIPLLEVMPDLCLGQPYITSLMAGDPLRSVIASMDKGLPLLQAVGELSQGLVALSSYLPVVADILPRETLLWKLQMLKSASAFANSRLRAVKAQTLILSSGRDQLLLSKEQCEQLQLALKCELRKFDDSGHFLFLEDDGVNLVTIIKRTGFYRHAKYYDYASDYIPPTPSEFKQVYDTQRWIVETTSPVMLSTLENGKIVNGLSGIPSEGPVLLVGYHMLLGWELVPMVSRFLSERNILLRGIAHPAVFMGTRDGNPLDPSGFDQYRLMGAAPVSGTYFYKLLSLKSHVLLYPGGAREAVHRKGEQYKLFWPERSEFVRMAARFGAKIIPFGVVGEDDVAEVFLDYDDQMKIPFLRDLIERQTRESVQLRDDGDGEVANQPRHVPGIFPKLPGRFYYLFGKPIETEGRKHVLRDREKSYELYLHVKSEVETCLAYLKEKREKDPYRNIFARLLYQATQGFTSEVPTFEL